MASIFRFPSYREDEGTYMSQAWSVIHQGTLAPYTYWYDHSPAGWFLLALWEVKPAILFHHHSPWIQAGCVCWHSTWFQRFYCIKLPKNYWRKAAAVIAALLFSLVPLAIIFHAEGFSTI